MIVLVPMRRKNDQMIDRIVAELRNLPEPAFAALYAYYVQFEPEDSCCEGSGISPDVFVQIKARLRALALQSNSPPPLEGAYLERDDSATSHDADLQS